MNSLLSLTSVAIRIGYIYIYIQSAPRISTTDISNNAYIEPIFISRPEPFFVRLNFQRIYRQRIYRTTRISNMFWTFGQRIYRTYLKKHFFKFHQMVYIWISLYSSDLWSLYRHQKSALIYYCLAKRYNIGFPRFLTSSANLARKKSVLAGKLKDVGYRQSWPALEKNILLSKFWQQKATLAEKLEDVSKRESWPMTHARRRFRGRKIPADTSDVFCSLSLSRT